MFVLLRHDVYLCLLVALNKQLIYVGKSQNVNVKACKKVNFEEGKDSPKIKASQSLLRKWRITMDQTIEKKMLS